MTDRVGQQLGNYRLMRLLGRGGFAEVYLGEHLHLGTQAAVKVLYVRLARKDDVEGFDKEARTIAHLKHPHIVRVLDYDVEEDTPFLVMDYASGGTLRSRHPKGTHLSLTTIISYVKEAADALQYAHDQRIIHRDVKPENLLVGEHNQLLLSDLGIATVAHRTSSQSTQAMAGTLPYMAPEQIRGQPRPASDQYSLGIVVYEWLSGSVPFHGSMIEIVAQHLAASPPSLQEQVPDISPDVKQVVLTALEKDPYKRFSSIKAFATALEQAYQNTQASPELPRVPWSSSASVITPGNQTLQVEPSVAEKAPSPEQPASQTVLPSPLSGTLPPVKPSEAPANPSSSTLLPTIPTQSPLRPDEPRTGGRTRRKASENLRDEQLPRPALGSSRPRSLVVPPRRMLIAGMSIIVVSVLLASLLGNWIVRLQAPRSTPTTTAIPTSTPTPTPTPMPAGIITEFPFLMANSAPLGITVGPDGNLWFTEEGSKIGRVTPTGTITEFPLPGSSYSGGITTGPDGNLWFTEGGSKIGRVTPTGTITEFPLPTSFFNSVDGITRGPDGNLWFTDQNGKIGRITPSGAVTEFSLPASAGESGGNSPAGITRGPDGNLWFTLEFGGWIGRITPSGIVTGFPLPTPMASSLLSGAASRITTGPDGNLWFTEGPSNKIGRITPEGTVTEFPLPTSGHYGNYPNGITTGPDGNLWFTEWNSDKIGRITPTGALTEFPVPTANSQPWGITAGPDGNLWFTESNGNRIGRITSGR